MKTIMVTAYLLLNAKPGMENKIALKLNRMREVKEANVVYGEYDIIIKVSLPTMNKLREFVINIRKNTEIERSSTLISTRAK